MSTYNRLKGVHDIVPPDAFIWNKIETTVKDLFYIFGYDEIKIPVIESTEIFTRSIGQSSDIVGKEMYTFMDKGGRSITLRPEGTASLVRCYVENGLKWKHSSPQKYYYMGPMFRYERPQKGRMRQFYQIGAECFAAAGPEADAEMLFMINEFFKKLKVRQLRLEINSIGCKVCRPAYKSALSEFFAHKEDLLCNDCCERLTKNPLRILDCKVDSCGQLRKGAPLIVDYLCEHCKSHHERLRELLDKMHLSFNDNPLIVRGLDYYTKTTFEFTTDHLGAQNAVAAGGRYDDLVEEFGGRSTPAIGFALGMERLADLVNMVQVPPYNDNGPFFYFAALGEDAWMYCLSIVNNLDKNITSICGEWTRSLKSHMNKASSLNAKYVVMLGSDEIQKGIATCKRLSDGSQVVIALAHIEDFVKVVQSGGRP